MRFSLLFSFVILLTVNQLAAQSTARTYDLEGHRGCRGLMPENTVPAFLKALSLGVNTLEMDVVISQDGQVVVSHEPYMNAEFCIRPDGVPVTKAEQKALILYKMPYADIKQYDTGSNGNGRFPEQQKQKTYKPLLSEVIAAAEAYRAENKLPSFGYNIELKSEPDQYDVSQPQPAPFCQLVNAVLTKASLDPSRIVIQSFDFAVLQEWNRQMQAKKALSVRLSALVENIRGVSHNLEKLGFKPAIYSPAYQLLSKDGIAELHQQGIKVIPWTVNNPADMRRLLELGVDGLITDYPDRAKGL
ncbi:glycerophosphodiester phosphodiesterase family protein [Fibrella aquatilis]|uniref:Glycerophosphodiester phosphodiesterase n=1 Tax=Fibrella aquatilis TaxID=2817059 RepID=A0A939GBU1_9BACT|nr:glycerophosphodiester phosphodiesterase family protein [Fibrella aquatilis]MBO0933975.1 glycerophosphodiester phosphodiesterase [Fibrella aquatilis]